MPMDDLFKALSVFKQGVNDLATYRAVTGANQEVQKLKASVMKDEEKQAGMRTIANDLTMRLSSIGANPAMVEQTAKAILPPEPSAFKQQLLLQKDRQAVDLQMQKDRQNFEQDVKIPAAQTAATTRAQVTEDKETRKEAFKTDKERRSLKETYKKQFTTSYEGMNKAARGAETVIKILKSGNKISANALRPLLARASGNVGNPTENEQTMFAGRQDILSKMSRWVSLGATSELPDEDAKELTGLAEQYLEIHKTGLEELAEMKVNQLSASELMTGEDPDKLISDMTGKLVTKRRQTAAPSSAPAGSGRTTGGAETRPVSKYLK